MDTCPEADLLLSSLDTKINMAAENRKCVGILGTGEYARAISKRLILSGYDVIMGSRTPAARQLSAFDECLCGVTLTSIDACVQQCDIIIAAIHAENFQETLAPRAGLFAGKVVVDVSNRTTKTSPVAAAQSNAEFLQSLLHDARVVKAFSTLSAYAVDDQSVAGSLRVLVASDDADAREHVLTVARDMGFPPCDMGSLKSARSMEASVLEVFPGWKVPLFFTLAVFCVWTLYNVYFYFIEKVEYKWDQVSHNIITSKYKISLKKTALCITFTHSNRILLHVLKQIKRTLILI
jgi:predicted dinucleotide-binding enzyme